MTTKQRGQLILLLAGGAVLLTCLGHGDGALLCAMVAAFLLFAVD